MNADIRDLVRQWLAKAASDWQTVEILISQDHYPRETVGFHCQQYVEKLLKALLTFHNIEAPKTHNLRQLIQLIEVEIPELLSLKSRSKELTEHGVETRYPDDWREISEEEMRSAIELAQEFSQIILSRLSSFQSIKYSDNLPK